MASSTGSAIAFTLALCSISVLVLLLLRHYLPLRTTPAYLLIPVFLAVVLPASIVLLVPIDLASNAVVEEDGVARGIWLDGKAILVLWRIAYWLTFGLTWFILPLLGDYSDSGYRDPKSRMMDSFRYNLRYQLIVLACSGAVLLYYILSNGFDTSSIKGTVMALAYAYGLILAIYLMGHGLVALPRRIIRSASVSGRLRRLQSRAPKVNDRMNEAIEELEGLESQVLQLRQRKTGSARNFQDWIEELADTSDLPESRAGRLPAARADANTVPSIITERYMADLTRKLKRARHKRIRFIEEWDRLIQDAQDDQAIMNAAASKRLDFGRSSPHSSLLERFKILNPHMRYYLHAKVIPGSRLLLGGFLALASVALIWSEVFRISRGLVQNLSVVGLSIVHHPSATSKGKIGFAGQLVAAAWLLYMCTAALTSVREVKVWGNRALVRRHTYSESAAWYATQVAKLTVPLSYNFITFLPKSIYQETAFYEFLGQLIDLTPVGTGFSTYFPLFILIPVCATAFGLYGRVKRFAGFGVLEDESEENESGFGTGGWREGRALIERDVIERQGNASSSNGGSRSQGLGLSYTDSSPRVAQGTFDAPYTDSVTDSAAPSRQPLPSSHVDSDAARAPEDRARLQQRRPPAEDTDESSNFFQDFAHRVRNTLDTTDRPDWLPNFSKPKWMQNNNDGDGSSGGRGPLDRLFGNAGGGLRL